jgi:hypothetical protein
VPGSDGIGTAAWSAANFTSEQWISVVALNAAVAVVAGRVVLTAQALASL